MGVKAKFKPEAASAVAVTAAEASLKAGVYRAEGFESNWRYVSFGTGHNLICVADDGSVMSGYPLDKTKLVRLKSVTAATFTFDEEDSA